MRYLVTISERVPTEDGSDLNTRHVVVNDLERAAQVLDNFWQNWGVLVSFTVVPLDD